MHDCHPIGPKPAGSLAICNDCNGCVARVPAKAIETGGRGASPGAWGGGKGISIWADYNDFSGDLPSGFTVSIAIPGSFDTSAS
jgi:hypothetical protein